MTVARDIPKAAREVADKFYFAGEIHDDLQGEVAALLIAERERCLAILAAEKEWGGDLDEVENRIRSGASARHIEGWS